MGVPFSQPRVEESGGRWKPLAVGALVVVAALAALYIFGRPKPTAPPTINPYAENLRLSDLKLSAAENFVGVSVNCLGGKIANVGNKTVTAATIEVVFRNSLGEVVQRENQPLMIMVPGPGGTYTDLVPVSKVGLHPNETREFRLTFEHISADWDRGYPELRFIQLTLQ